MGCYRVGEGWEFCLDVNVDFNHSAGASISDNIPV